MPDYDITFTRPARKELESLESVLIQRIFSKIESLSNEPRPSGCRKLKGRRNLWRVRVGDYRVVYSINDDTRIVDVIIVRHREDAYR